MNSLTAATILIVLPFSLSANAVQRTVELEQLGSYASGVFANEGDSRDYNGFSGEARINDLVLDPQA